MGANVYAVVCAKPASNACFEHAPEPTGYGSDVPILRDGSRCFDCSTEARQDVK